MTADELLMTEPSVETVNHANTGWRLETREAKRERELILARIWVEDGLSGKQAASTILMMQRCGIQPEDIYEHYYGEKQ